MVAVKFCADGGHVAACRPDHDPPRASNITNYSDPSIRSPIGIAVGSDRAVCFTDSLWHDTIGRISNTGIVRTLSPRAETMTPISVTPSGLVSRGP